MPYKAVIFDLYGTLVGNFSRKGYDLVQKEIAKILNVPYPKFWQTMGETLKDRSLGAHRSVEANFVEVCRRLGVESDRRQIEKTVALNYEFTRNSIIPEPEVLEALDMLKHLHVPGTPQPPLSRGQIGDSSLRLGLITNCNANVPLLFSESLLAQYIDAPVFSCEERIKKPTPRIYQIACERLKVEPQECFYVGDGSGGELTGAAAIGMLPILKRTDLTDVYDPHRPEIENWQGIAIDEISELCTIISELA